MCNNISQSGETVKQKLQVIEGTGEILIDLNSRGKDRNWGLKKSKNVKMSDIIAKANVIQNSETGAPLLSPMATKWLNDCGAWLLFDHYADNTKKLALAPFCKNRLCPMCNWRKSIKLFGQVSEIVAAILADGAKVRFVFVTFTVKNCTAEELPHVIDRMNEAFKWLTQKGKTFKLAKKLKKYLHGYMKAMEITYNPAANTYHPHIHAIFEIEETYFQGANYINMNGWRELWAAAMHIDYTPQVDAKTIKMKNGQPDPGAVAEVAKYPVKVDGLLGIQDIDTAARAAITLHTVSKNRRFVTFGGDFRTYAARLKLDDLEKGDLVHVETDNENKTSAVYQTMWRYNARFGVYIN